MTRELDKAQLARSLGVAERTVERWVSRGCPSRRGDNNRLLFVEADVRRWAAANGLSGQLGRPTYSQDPPAAPASATPDGPVSTFSSLQKAELAGKIARARKTELEVQQEKNLKELGLGDRIRGARNFEALGDLTADVAAALAEGALKPERANALHRLIVERRRQLTKLQEDKADNPLGGRVLLCTADAEDLVRAFDSLYSDERRERLLAFAADLLEEDLLETPPTDTSTAAPLPAPAAASGASEGP